MSHHYKGGPIILPELTKGNAELMLQAPRVVAAYCAKYQNVFRTMRDMPERVREIILANHPKSEIAAALKLQ